MPLGKEMHQAFCNIGVNAGYADFKEFKQKLFYKLRAGYRKALNKRENTHNFYYFPVIDEENFEEYLIENSPTIVLVIGFAYKYLSPQFLEKLKHQYHVSIYLYDTDSCNLYSKRREFIFFIENELPIYDEIFSFSKVTTNFFCHTRKLKATFFPFGAIEVNSNQNSTSPIDVLFVGSCDLRRIFLLETIRDKVSIYGNRWRRNTPLISDELMTHVIDKPVWGESLYQLLYDSKIVINITRSPFYGAETGVNLRIFEALSAGCFLLTDYCEELADLFIVGEEIEVFRNARELKEKVSFYLNHQEKRKSIASKGHARFIKEYSWDARVKELASKLSLLQ